MELQDSMMRRIGFVMIRLVFELHVDFEAVEEEKGGKAVEMDLGFGERGEKGTGEWRGRIRLREMHRLIQEEKE